MDILLNELELDYKALRARFINPLLDFSKEYLKSN